MIHVVAIITTNPGQRETVLQAFRANVPAVHAEDGCIEYGATVDADAGSIQTKEGVTHYDPGDYIVSNKEDGSDEYAVAAAKFESLYTPADQDS